MADVTGLKWRLDFFQGVVNTTNDAMSSLLGGLDMDKTEVTEEAYAKVMGQSPSHNGPRHPVTLVSYNDAAEYCKRVGKRLPSGAEWEKFAGTKTFATHDGTLIGADGKKNANFNSSGLQEVASYMPNENGMYDMTGNVWEWVTDGRALKDIRGGSWVNSVTDYLRVGFRSSYMPYLGFTNVGFRCVFSPDSQPPTQSPLTSKLSLKVLEQMNRPNFIVGNVTDAELAMNAAFERGFNAGLDSNEAERSTPAPATTPNYYDWQPQPEIHHHHYYYRRRRRSRRLEGDFGGRG